jgi:hypothetical protein
LSAAEFSRFQTGANMPEKIALCVGINKYPAGSELYGCVNDARDWATLLQTHGYEIFRVLLDKEATGDAIRESILWCVQYLGPGDELLVTNSSHGTSIPGGKDEIDNRTEAICPVDLHNGPILDDELWEIFAQAHPKSKPGMISDSCFSGTVTRMQPAEGRTPRIRFLPPAFFIGDAKAERLARELPTTVVGPTRSVAVEREVPHALLLAAADDSQYAYDAYFGTRPNGAYTRAAIDTFKKGMTYNQWHAAIRKKLPSVAYPQTPQLLGTPAQRRRKVFA